MSRTPGMAAAAVLQHMTAVGEPLSTRQIADGLGWPYYKARNAMQTLHRRGAIRIDLQGDRRNASLWSPGDDGKAWLPRPDGVRDRLRQVREFMLQGLTSPQMLRLMRLPAGTVRHYIQLVLKDEGCTSMREVQAREIERLQAELARVSASSRDGPVESSVMVT